MRKLDKLLEKEKKLAEELKKVKKEIDQEEIKEIKNCIKKRNITFKEAVELIEGEQDEEN